MERGDFLRLFGAGAGLVGLGAVTGASPVQGGQGRTLVVLSHGSDDPNRAVLALLLASAAVKKGNGPVQIWMTLGGAEVAHRKKVEALKSPIFAAMGSASSLLAELAAKGVTLKICPPCAVAAGATGEERHPAVEEAGGDWLLANLPGAEVVWL
jgi:predicted peroxiredoxin